MFATFSPKLFTSTPTTSFGVSFLKLVQHRFDDSGVAVLVSINPRLTEVGTNLIGKYDFDIPVDF